MHVRLGTSHESTADTDTMSFAPYEKPRVLGSSTFVEESWLWGQINHVLSKHPLIASE